MRRSSLSSPPEMDTRKPSRSRIELPLASVSEIVVDQPAIVPLRIVTLSWPGFAMPVPIGEKPRNVFPPRFTSTPSAPIVQPPFPGAPWQSIGAVSLTSVVTVPPQSTLGVLRVASDPHPGPAGLLRVARADPVVVGRSELEDRKPHTDRPRGVVRQGRGDSAVSEPYAVVFPYSAQYRTSPPELVETVPWTSPKLPVTLDGEPVMAVAQPEQTRAEPGPRGSASASPARLNQSATRGSSDR